MMSNLFSIFDPSSSSMSLIWAVTFLMLGAISTKVWKSQEPSQLIKSSILKKMFNEISFTMKKTNKSEVNFIISLFIIILLMNVVALFPQVFSISSHLCVTLPLALLAWLTLNMMGWLKKTSHMLAHLVPQGTPGMLMSFMVLIEMTSNIIRPITLCVRLTANMIAGHLLMTLLGNALVNLSASVLTLGVALPLILTTLESAVAFIQAYVFMTLTTLYMTEIK